MIVQHSAEVRVERNLKCRCLVIEFKIPECGDFYVRVVSFLQEKFDSKIIPILKSSIWFTVRRTLL